MKKGYIMSQKTKYILITLIALFLIIQLIPVDRENPYIESNAEIKTSPEVKNILKKSCYDCHSNQTNWPFYSYIAPISWLVSSDVSDGRKHLNFTEWNNLSPEKIVKIKSEIEEEISEDEMPLPSYTFIHSDAKLSAEQKNILKNWINVNKND
jgi:hypothetical protein